MHLRHLSSMHSSTNNLRSMRRRHPSSMLRKQLRSMLHKPNRLRHNRRSKWEYTDSVHSCNLLSRKGHFSNGYDNTCQEGW